MIWVSAWDNRGQGPEGWGSHIMLKWFDWEPSRGQYNYAAVDAALAARERPCYLQIGFSMYNKALKAPEDYTPKAHRKSLVLTGANGQPGYVPDYNPAWVDALSAATRALAERYREHPRVAGFWAALGWNQESQAAYNNSGGAWADQVKGQLSENAYLDFITRYAGASRAAWGGVPVYLPAVPAPGGLWGHSRRDVIARLLEDGCGYMNCGLLPDFQNSYGVGARAGLAAHDIVIGRTERVGFEEGPRQARDNPGELYYMTMRALNARADFLCLYGSLSAPQAPTVATWLPRWERWLLWRVAEYGPVTWPGADGKLYGTTGEPGCWGAGLTWEGGGALVFNAARYDFSRHYVNSAEPVRVRITGGAAAAAYEVTALDPAGGATTLTVPAVDDVLTLPPGAYHRVEVRPYASPPRELLPTDEPRATAGKVRWWLEEEKRAREAGQPERADAILTANIELAYRMERGEP